MVLKSTTCEVPGTFRAWHTDCSLSQRTNWCASLIEREGVRERTMEGNYRRRRFWRAPCCPSVEISFGRCDSYRSPQLSLVSTPSVPGCDRFTLRGRNRGSPAQYIEPS